MTDILSGMGGLITRDSIRKPAWYALLFLRKLKVFLVGKGDNYIITRDKSWRFTIAMHNFKAHNYLYYLKKENETTLQDHYRYFENMEDKRIELEVYGVPNGRYMLRRSTLNRKYGSLMDEWLQMGCFYNLNTEDIDYLKGICTPKITLRTIEVKNGVMSLPTYLRPLEITLLEITPIR